jgi:hypothetical protein
MRNSRVLHVVFLILTATLLYACTSPSIALRHPEAVKGMPDCAECHNDSWGALNHKAVDFYSKHRFYASQPNVCMACHTQSFCSDCHAHKEEIKPSDKYKESPELNLPHRGDYFSQHKIDGRINPASCAKCHGRQNNERCKTCHR